MGAPRVFHRIWIGPDPLPDSFAAFGESWVRHHPHWEHRLWTEENLPEVTWTEVLDTRRVPAERANILRYELLLRFGGVYLDADLECLRPIDALIDGLGCFAAEAKPGRVDNAIIGARPGHPALQACVERLRPMPDFLRTGVARHDKNTTGGRFFNRIISERRDDVHVFGPEHFHPATPQQRARAYAVHHAAKSWRGTSETDDLRFRLEQLTERVEELEARLHSVNQKSRRRYARLRGKPDRYRLP